MLPTLSRRDTAALAASLPDHSLECQPFRGRELAGHLTDKEETSPVSPVMSPCTRCIMLSDADHCCTLVTGAVVLLSLSQAAVDTLLLSPVLCSSPTLQLTADSRLTLSCRGLSRRCRQSLARPAALLCLRNEQSPVTRQQLGTQPAASLSWASVARCDDRRQSWSGSQQAASLQNYPSAA